MTAQFVTANRFHPNILDKLGIKVNGGNHQEPVRRRKEVLFSFSRLPESELDLRGCGPLFLPFRCLGEKGERCLTGRTRLNVSNGAVKVVECRGGEAVSWLLVSPFFKQKRRMATRAAAGEVQHALSDSRLPLRFAL